MSFHKSSMEESSKLNIFVVAGEASADLHAAELLRELKKRHPQLRCYGVGGKNLAAEGMEVSVDAGLLNVVGVSDWFDKFGQIIGIYRSVVRQLRKQPPTVAILLDLPDFNLRLAKVLKQLGVPVVYYISPQVWAWRKYRIRKIRSTVDRMLVVFPFEKTFYRQNGVDVEFVGHPLLDTLTPRSSWREQSEIREAPRVAVLPGSRHSEVRFHGPLLEQYLYQLFQQYPKAQVKIPVASTLELDFLRASIVHPKVEFIKDDSRSVLAWADLAMVASGTATLETALIGTPFCLFYRVSTSSAWLFRHVARYRGFLGMPNLLHGREVVRELFQERATAEALMQETKRLVEEFEYRQTMTELLRQCRALLGEPGANIRAAEQVSEVILQIHSIPSSTGLVSHEPATAT